MPDAMYNPDMDQERETNKIIKDVVGETECFQDGLYNSQAQIREASVSTHTELGRDKSNGTYC